MPRPLTILTGRRFGRLLVLAYLGKVGGKHMWQCQCDCGKTRDVVGFYLLGGGTTSCGCYRSELSRARKTSVTHGMSASKTYSIWRGMVSRCHNPRSAAYRYYGGRGIEVCQEWRDSFEAFVRDMGECPPGLSIDRKDNDKGYFHDNCRWATQTEQVRNSGVMHWITIDGRTQCLADWCAEYGVRVNTVCSRIADGWSERDAVLKPARARRTSVQMLGDRWVLKQPVPRGGV